MIIKLVMLSHDAITLCPSKQWIANLIQYEVAISVTPTYNTTNSSNKSLSHQFIGNILGKKTAETSFFSAVTLYTHMPLVLHRNHPNVKFVPITTPFTTHIPSTFHCMLIRHAFRCKISGNCLKIALLHQFNSIIPPMFQYHIH